MAIGSSDIRVSRSDAVDSESNTTCIFGDNCGLFQSIKDTFN